VRAYEITLVSVASCPKISLDPGHYRADGTCECAKPSPWRPGDVVRIGGDTYALMMGNVTNPWVCLTYQEVDGETDFATTEDINESNAVLIARDGQPVNPKEAP
jgi:hypothetical protein